MNRYARFCEAFLGDQMSMDARHAAAIRRFLLAIDRPANVIEVGCHHGVSTAEVLAACEEADFACTLIDTLFQDSVKAMVREAAGKVHLVTDAGHSVAVIGDYVSDQSVVILDGDHRAAYMELESEVLERKPPRAIVLHDIAAFQQPGCDGPVGFCTAGRKRGTSSRSTTCRGQASGRIAGWRSCATTLTTCGRPWRQCAQSPDILRFRPARGNAPHRRADFLRLCLSARLRPLRAGEAAGWIRPPCVVGEGAAH